MDVSQEFLVVSDTVLMALPDMNENPQQHYVQLFRLFLRGGFATNHKLVEALKESCARWNYEVVDD